MYINEAYNEEIALIISCLCWEGPGLNEGLQTVFFDPIVSFEVILFHR